MVAMRLVMRPLTAPPYGKLQGKRSYLKTVQETGQTKVNYKVVEGLDLVRNDFLHIKITLLEALKGLIFNNQSSN